MDFDKEGNEEEFCISDSGDTEERSPGFKEKILDYCAFVKETLAFGDRIDREEFFVFMGATAPVLTGNQVADVRVMRDFVLSQTKALSMLKSELEKAPFDLVVARNISDRILDPNEVETFAYKVDRDKKAAVDVVTERRLEVVERYRAAGMIKDKENASRFVKDQSRANRKVKSDAFGQPIM